MWGRATTPVCIHFLPADKQAGQQVVLGTRRHRLRCGSMRERVGQGGHAGVPPLVACTHAGRKPKM